MTYTYAPGAQTDLNRVRLLLPDHTEELILFQDEEITQFIELGGSVFGGTALALETISTSEALIQKVVRMAGVTTDGAKLAAELRARAKDLRTLTIVDRPTDVTELFDWAEMVYDPWTAAERAHNEIMRMDG